MALDADTVVFDNELKPSQQFKLEQLLGRTALDRTDLSLRFHGALAAPVAASGVGDDM